MVIRPARIPARGLVVDWRGVVELIELVMLAWLVKDRMARKNQ